MAIYGYMRVSSNDGSQRLDRQVDAFKKWSENNQLNFDEVFSDKQSGKDMNRPDYQRLKATSLHSSINISSLIVIVFILSLFPSINSFPFCDRWNIDAKFCC